MNKKITDLLYRSFDAELTEQERQTLHNAMSEDEQIAEQKQIEKLRKNISKNAIRTFKPFFAKRVIHEITRRQEAANNFLPALLWSFRRVVIIAATIIIYLVANNALRSGGLAPDDLFAMPEETLEETIELNILQSEDL